MKRIKRLVSFCLTAVLIAGMFSGMSFASALTANDLATRLNAFKAQYPQGTIRYDLKANGGGGFHGGWQCYGFADHLYHTLFGGCMSSGQARANVNDLCVGDVIRYNTWYGSDHSMAVADIIGDTVYIADCNFKGYDTCSVDYSRTVSKSELQSWINRDLAWTRGSRNYNNGKGYFLHCSGNYVTTLQAVAKPAAPSSASLTPADSGIGGVLTARWIGVSGADRYKVTLKKGDSPVESHEVTDAGYTFLASTAGQYKIEVWAHNIAGWSDTSVASGTVTVHTDCSVTFQDYDGTVLKIQAVHYGKSASAPAAPSREGYTFQGWDKSLQNITSNTVVTATYKINKYSVKFVDAEGELVNVQTVEYGSSAKAPTVTPPAGYVFVDWDSHDYECVKKDMTVTAVIAWENPDLPNLITIESAVRNQEREGYDVAVAMKNYPDSSTRGRVIVALKTEEGKMVAVTTETYHLSVLAEKTQHIFVPYTGVATTAEVSVVGLLEEDNTGVPLAKMASLPIDLGLAWSDWSTNPPPEGDGYLTESREQYRYRERKTTSSSSPSMSGWTQTGKAATGWTAWSDWSGTPVSASSTRQVETRWIEPTYKTQYIYYHYCDCRTNSAYTGAVGQYRYYHEIRTDSLLPYYATWSGIPIYTSGSGWKCGGGNSNFWINGGTTSVVVSNGYTQYRSRTATYTYYFEKWTDWSDWQTGTVPAAGSNKKVETRTVHRFKSNDIKLTAYNYKRYRYTSLADGEEYYTYSAGYPDSMGYPGQWEYNKSYSELQPVASVDNNITIYNGYKADSWYRGDVNQESAVKDYITYDTLEDTKGAPYTVSGQLPFAGKAATLLVFRQTNTDPTASQLEYVDQVVLANDGSYDFTFKTKEEPTAETGDFIIMLAVEGGTGPIYIDRIQAPKPTYTVVFTDENGKELSRQGVMEGKSPVLPAAPVKEGYEFVSWDVNLTNVHNDITAVPEYKKKTFTVVFVDYEREYVEIKEFQYGDVLYTDKLPQKEGHTFANWEKDGEELTIVTQNMIVEAHYTANRYNVTFLNWDGSVFSNQTVPYGQAAEFPDLENPTNGKLFAGWDAFVEAQYVTDDLIVRPLARFASSAATPEVKIDDAKDGKTVTLTCTTPGAVIYVTTDGTLPQYEVLSDGTVAANGTLYTAPVTIKENMTLLAVAFAEGMNASEVAVVNLTGTAEKAVYGDVDQNGLIDAADALKVLQYSVGKIDLTESQLLAAEVDGKEGINAADALCILKKAVHKIERFPVEAAA